MTVAHFLFPVAEGSTLRLQSPPRLVAPPCPFAFSHPPCLGISKGAERGRNNVKTGNLGIAQQSNSSLSRPRQAGSNQHEEYRSRSVTR